jgi:hypothetical protein
MYVLCVRTRILRKRKWKMNLGQVPCWIKGEQVVYLRCFNDILSFLRCRCTTNRVLIAERTAPSVINSAGSKLLFSMWKEWAYLQHEQLATQDVDCYKKCHEFTRCPSGTISEQFTASWSASDSCHYWRWGKAIESFCSLQFLNHCYVE